MAAGNGVPEGGDARQRGARYVSLKDVAAAAGVSFQTASKVLNGRGKVAPATEAEIFRAVRELGYVRNALARSLVTAGSRAVGVVTSTLSDQIMARFVAGAEAEARRQGFVVVLVVLGASGADVGENLELLAERRVDGILVAAPEAEGDPAIAGALRGRAPIVSLHRLPGERVPLVGSDHVETGLLATRHLLLHGHEIIGTIIGPRERQVSHARLAGYRAALAERGASCDDALVEEADWTAAGAYLATVRLLERLPSMSALFAQNDDMALGALRALHEAGRRSPEDFAVVGCDDTPISAYTWPPLTTVRIPFEQTGRVAMAQLLGMARGEPPPPNSTLLPVELVARESCGCNSAAAHLVAAGSL